jgi:hypothetical protein
LEADSQGFQGSNGMAGDFVMVQFATPRKPEVMRIATELNIDAAHAFGLCVIAWMWFDEQTEDGRAVGATDAMLDAVVCRAGFSDALRNVGWLHVRDGALVVPNFDRLMGDSAKKRAKNTKRQQQHRRNATVTKTSRHERDKSATKEEKRREEKRETTNVVSHPLPPCLETEKFRSAWERWERHRREIGKPLKPTMRQSQLAMLAAKGESDAVAMIDHTIAMGWQGLRAPEPETRGSTPQQPPRKTLVDLNRELYGE